MSSGGELVPMSSDGVLVGTGSRQTHVDGTQVHNAFQAQAQHTSSGGTHGELSSASGTVSGMIGGTQVHAHLVGTSGTSAQGKHSQDDVEGKLNCSAQTANVEQEQGAAPARSLYADVQLDDLVTLETEQAAVSMLPPPQRINLSGSNTEPGRVKPSGDKQCRTHDHAPDDGS